MTGRSSGTRSMPKTRGAVSHRHGASTRRANSIAAGLGSPTLAIITHAAPPVPDTRGAKRGAPAHLRHAGPWPLAGLGTARTRRALRGRATSVAVTLEE